MVNPVSYPFCSAFYFVEKSIEVVVTLKTTRESARIRIDALHSTDPSNSYSTNAYVEEEIMVQPAYPQTHGRFYPHPKAMTVWIGYDLPWTSGNSADDALAQALGFLGDRCT
jgi:hypothetical protein